MLNKAKEAQDVSFQISLRSSRGGWKAARVSTRKHSWRVAVAFPGAPYCYAIAFLHFSNAAMGCFALLGGQSRNIAPLTLISAR